MSVPAKRSEHPVSRFRDEIDRMFHDFFGGRPNGPFPGSLLPELWGVRPGGGWAPAVDVYEKDGALQVEAELPGVKPEDVSVTCEDNRLVIQGSTHLEKEEKREGYYWSERRSGSFRRTVPLPEGANLDAATATFKDGVLRVSIPHPPQPETSAARKIPIKS
jgi:HSP20 family protein